MSGEQQAANLDRTRIALAANAALILVALVGALVRSAAYFHPGSLTAPREYDNAVMFSGLRNVRWRGAAWSQVEQADGVVLPIDRRRWWFDDIQQRLFEKHFSREQTFDRFWLWTRDPAAPSTYSPDETSQRRLRMAEPRISVIVPVFNGAGYLESTLSSLELQAIEGLEVIVVDDGSTDGSDAVAESHSIVPRVVRQANCGVAASRNRGLAMAGGTWVAFVDQDDLWHFSRLPTLLGVADEQGLVAIASSDQAFGVVEDRAALEAIGDGRECWPSHWVHRGEEIELAKDPDLPLGNGEISQITLEQLMQGPAAVTTSVIYRREAAIVAGGCAPHIKAADDHILNVNFARIFGPILRINFDSLLYRVHSESTTTLSPLVAPFLTSLLALRMGRALPNEKSLSPYIENLLYGLPGSGLSAMEQSALLTMVVPQNELPQWLWRLSRRRASRAIKRLMSSCRR